MTKHDAGELAALVERIAQGSSRAEAALYLRLRSDVRGFAARYADTPEDADDLASDSWETLLVKLRAGALRDAAAVRAFAQGVVRRRAAGHRRRYASQYETDDTQAVEQTAAPIGGQPECEVIAEQVMRLAADAIEQLPVPRDRHVLMQMLFHDTSSVLLAASLGMAPSQMHRVSSRARRRLCEALLAVQCEQEWMRLLDQRPSGGASPEKGCACTPLIGPFTAAS